MRTDILQQVATLQLESTFLHLRLAAKKSEPSDRRNGGMFSNDSQTVTHQYQDDCEHQGSRGQSIISARAGGYRLLYGGFNLCKSESLLKASLSDHGQPR